MTWRDLLEFDNGPRPSGEIWFAYSDSPMVGALLTVSEMPTAFGRGFACGSSDSNEWTKRETRAVRLFSVCLSGLGYVRFCITLERLPRRRVSQKRRFPSRISGSWDTTSLATP